MKVSELAERSGLTVQTIKFYIREGLLPRGTATAATQAEYGAEHLDRLRLIRALREVAELPVAAIRPVVDALDDPDRGLHERLGAAQYALGPPSRPQGSRPPGDEAEWREAKAQVDGLLAELGWQVSELAPARDQLVQAVTALRGLGLPPTAGRLRPYVEAAADLGRREVEGLDTEAPARMLQRQVAETVLYERILVALKRLAQEDASARRFGIKDHEMSRDSGSVPPI